MFLLKLTVPGVGVSPPMLVLPLEELLEEPLDELLEELLWAAPEELPDELDPVPGASLPDPPPQADSSKHTSSASDAEPRKFTPDMINSVELLN